MLNQRYKTFLCVAETGRVSDAAKKLNLTQPAVSQHLKALEEETGTKLYTREKNGIHLTRGGVVALRFISRIATIEERMSRELKDVADHKKSLVIGITESIENTAIVEILARYGAENGGMTITFLTDSVENLYTRLKLYEADFIVVNGSVGHDKRLDKKLLFSDELVFAVSKDHPLAAEREIGIEELKKQPLILCERGVDSRMEFESYLNVLNDHITNYRVTFETNDVAVVKSLVSKGFGGGILYRSSCVMEETRGELVLLPVKQWKNQSEINMFYQKDYENMEQLEEIKRLVHDSYGKYAALTV